MATFIIVLTVAAFVFGFPVPVPFSLTTSTPGLAAGAVCGPAQSFHQGAAVTFSWNSGNGQSVTLSVHDPATSNNIIYTSSGSSGSGSFTASGNPIGFCVGNLVSAQASVSGSASEPVWYAL